MVPKASRRPMAPLLFRINLLAHHPHCHHLSPSKLILKHLNLKRHLIYPSAAPGPSLDIHLLDRLAYAKTEIERVCVCVLEGVSVFESCQESVSACQ